MVLVTCLQSFNVTIDMFAFIPRDWVSSVIVLLTCLHFSTVTIDIFTFIPRGVVGYQVSA